MTIKVKYIGKNKGDYVNGDTYYLTFGIQQDNRNFAKGHLFVHRIGEPRGNNGYWSMKTLEFFHSQFELV